MAAPDSKPCVLSSGSKRRGAHVSGAGQERANPPVGKPLVVGSAPDGACEARAKHLFVQAFQLREGQILRAERGQAVLARRLCEAGAA